MLASGRRGEGACRAAAAEVLQCRLGTVVAAVAAAWWQQLGGSDSMATVVVAAE